MLLYVTLYMMLACLMLSAALSNAVCFYIAFFLPLTFSSAFCFHASFWVIDTVCLFQILFCIMFSAFNMFVLLILCSHL